VPLKHTDVKGYLRVYRDGGVRQQFHNPYRQDEAVYVFFLCRRMPRSNEFVMTIGQRRFAASSASGRRRSRSYNDAKSQDIASLLPQERPNIFTQSVATSTREADRHQHPILPHASYVDGWYEYVFPMVVGRASIRRDQRRRRRRGARRVWVSGRRRSEYLPSHEAAGTISPWRCISTPGSTWSRWSAQRIASRRTRIGRAAGGGEVAESDSIPNRVFLCCATR